MLNAIVQGLIGCVVFSVIYLGLSGISLIYYVAKYHPPKNSLIDFLENLRFPIDRIAAFLPTGKPQSAAEYIDQIEYKNAKVLRYFSGIIIVGILLLLVEGLRRQSTGEGILAVAIIFIFCLVSSFFTWRFGHIFRIQ